MEPGCGTYGRRSLLIGRVGVLASLVCAASLAQSAMGYEGRPPGRARPPEAALDACSSSTTGAACEFHVGGEPISGRCHAPDGHPLACRPDAHRAARPSTDAARARVESRHSTDGVLCDVAHRHREPSVGLESRYGWQCSDGRRHLAGNGVPDHEVGAFPNPGNPNAITEQSISVSMPLDPALTDGRTHVGGPGGVGVFALNSVKFDPGTGGACPDGAADPGDCPLGGGRGRWRIEALGQDVFDFGEDENHAHVQPTGEYHYHGIPEGILERAGASDTNRRMLLVGWASDGFPVYARYCYADAMNAASAVTVCRGSYTLDDVPDRGRPSASWVPLGAFASDWNYTEGSGDLDECNGRVGVTPEFPGGIYYYMATDDYPYFSRCLRGALETAHAGKRPPSPDGRPRRQRETRS